MLKSGKRKYEKVQEAYEKLKDSTNQKKKKKQLNYKEQEQKKEEEWVTDEEEEEKNQNKEKQDSAEELEFEDEFDDEYEDELGEENNDHELEIQQKQSDNENEIEIEKEQKQDPLDKEEDYVDIVTEKKQKNKKKEKQQNAEAFLGTQADLKEGEELQVDNHAYEFLHRANTEWPCLTFDFLLTEQERTQTVFQNKYNYPLELYMVAGTSGATGKGSSNALYVIGMYNLFSTKNDDDSEDDDDAGGEEEGDTQPKLIVQAVDTKASVNRVKSWRNTPIVACWEENGDVCVYDLSKQFESAQKKEKQQKELKSKNKGKLQWTPPEQLIKTWKNQTEGFALGWQHIGNAIFATGDNTGKIYIYRGGESGWERDTKAIDLYKVSVEDLQFSHNDENIFVCCATDGSFSGVDLRSGPIFTCKKAHSQDINVLDWNTGNHNLLATGGEDGLVKVWDLRMCKNSKPEPVAEVGWHKGAITGLGWQVGEESSCVSAGVDDRVAIWDFAVEAEGVGEKETIEGVPEQLMFVHMGVENVREAGWHPVMREVVVSTAANGFNVFRPAFDEGEDDEDDELDNKKVIKEQELDKYLGNLKIND